MATIAAPLNSLHDLKQQLTADVATCDTVVADMQTYLNIASPSNAQHFAQVKTLSQDVRALARIQKRTLKALKDVLRELKK